MTWGRHDRDEQRHRGKALTTALGMPLHIPIQGGRGSLGGAPIWQMHVEGFGLMPRPGYEGPRGIPHVSDAQAGTKSLLRLSRNTAEQNARVQRGDLDPERNEGDPDAYAVFGRYPKGFLDHVIKRRLLGDVRRDEVLHVCSGTLTEQWTADLRAEARPRVQADGTTLPFRAGAFKAVLLDPPYSDAYARNLYGVENPRPAWLLKEAARVVVPCGYIGILHVAIPFAPPGCHLVRVWPVSTGVGFRIRALSIYQREQERLL